MSCVAPGCTSNYKSQEHRTPSFAFPSDEEIREKWFRAIPRRREDYEGNVRLRVCLNHFSEKDSVRDIEYFDGVKMIKKPREKLTIKKTAIPTIFFNCPSYMTDTTQRPKRLSLANKEEEMFQKALRMSQLDDNDTVVKFLVTSFSQLVDHLNLLDLKNGWATHDTRANSVFFCKIIVSSRIPSIERRLKIDDDLNTQAFYMENILFRYQLRKLVTYVKLRLLSMKLTNFLYHPKI